MMKNTISKLHEEIENFLQNVHFHLDLTNMTLDHLNYMFSSNSTSDSSTDLEQLNAYIRNMIVNKLVTLYNDGIHIKNKFNHIKLHETVANHYLWKEMMQVPLQLPTTASLSSYYSYTLNRYEDRKLQLSSSFYGSMNNPATSVLVPLLIFLVLMIVNRHRQYKKKKLVLNYNNNTRNDSSIWCDTTESVSRCSSLLVSSSSVTCDRFYYQPSVFNTEVVHRIKKNVGRYQPPFWYSPLLGTIISFGHDPAIQYERELKVCHKRQHYVDWYPHRPALTAFTRSSSTDGDEKKKDKSTSATALSSTSNKSYTMTSTSADATHAATKLKIILFLPGLGLSSKSKCVKQFVSTCWSAGFHCGVINPRGVDLPLKSDNLWYPGLHDDCEEVLCGVEKDFPHTPIFLVGFSAGTQILQRTLLHRHNSFYKQHDHDSNTSQLHISSKHHTSASASAERVSSAGNIKGCMSICVNQDYVLARSNLESSLMGKMLSYLTAWNGKELLRKNKHFFKSQEKLELLTKVLSSKSLSELDPHLALLYGHRSEKEYYDAISCTNYSHLEIPALFVQPADDPLHMGNVRDNINTDLYLQSPNIVYYEPAFGNHFGFIEGSIHQAFTSRESYTYPAKLAIEFFNTILDEQTALS